MPLLPALFPEPVEGLCLIKLYLALRQAQGAVSIIVNKRKRMVSHQFVVLHPISKR